MVTATPAAPAGRQGPAWEVAASVTDPEMPMLTLADLGVLRSVTAGEAGTVVTVTPTYSGCPATTEIRRELRRRLEDAGFAPVEVRTALAPPWSTDWISAAGRRKLAAAGIAPPGPVPAPAGPTPVALTGVAARGAPSPACPNCGSGDTVELSRFAATACTALRRCRACAEPFPAVKPI